MIRGKEPLNSIRINAKPKDEVEMVHTGQMDQHPRYRSCDVTIISASDLGAKIGATLMHRGVGTLRIYDTALVVASQAGSRIKSAKVADQYAARQLAKRLENEASAESIVHGYPFPYDSVVAFPATVVILCQWPDSRWAVYRDHLHTKQTPFLVAATNKDQSHGFVWVPWSLSDEPWDQLVAHRGSFANNAPWKSVGNSNSVLAQTAALACSAVEEVVMGCTLPWSFVEVFFTNQIRCRFYPWQQPSEWSLTIDDYVTDRMVAA
jgi:hypothetical protein